MISSVKSGGNEYHEKVTKLFQTCILIILIRENVLSKVVSLFADKPVSNSNRDCKCGKRYQKCDMLDSKSTYIHPKFGQYLSPFSPAFRHTSFQSRKRGHNSKHAQFVANKYHMFLSTVTHCSTRAI